MFDNQIIVSLSSLYSANELSTMDSEDREDCAKEEAWNEVSSEDILNAHEYDYVADLPHCQDEDEVQSYLEKIVDHLEWDLQLDRKDGDVYYFNVVAS
mgnify:FL=1